MTRAIPPPSAEETLRLLLDSVSPLPDQEWAWLRPALLGRSFDAGEALVRVGADDGGIHFLCLGLVRYFYLTADGTERNHAFAREGNLVGCFPVLAGAGACTFAVEALEPTVTLYIPAANVRQFPQRHPCWARLWMRLVEHVALRKAAREAEFLLDSAEARYRRFVVEYSELEVRLPQYHIASYLGITPVALSRIRGRINRS